MRVMVNERGQRIGEGHRRAVLSDDEVEHLLKDRGPEDAPRMSYTQLARKYRISKSSVRDIVTGRRRGQRGVESERPPAKVAEQDRVLIQVKVSLRSRHYIRARGGGKFIDTIVPGLMQQEDEKTAALMAVPHFEFLTMQQITGCVVPVTSRTIRRWVEAGIFPEPQQKGARTNLWRRCDIVSWVEGHYRLVYESMACRTKASKGAHLSAGVTPNIESAQCADSEVR